MNPQSPRRQRQPSPVSADCVGAGTVGTCEKCTNSVQRSCVLRRSVVRTRNHAVLALHIVVGIPLHSACQLDRVLPVQMFLLVVAGVTTSHGIGCLNSV